MTATGAAVMTAAPFQPCGPCLIASSRIRSDSLRRASASLDTWETPSLATRSIQFSNEHIQWSFDNNNLYMTYFFITGVRDGTPEDLRMRIIRRGVLFHFLVFPTAQL
jgi:hypothetical protein